MLPCIVCSKRMHDDDEDTYDSNISRPFSERDTSMKSLTSQLKDIVLKASANYKHCRPGSAAIFDHGTPNFKEYAAISGTSSDMDHLKPSIHFALASSACKDDTSANLPKPDNGVNANYAPKKIASSSSPKHVEAPQQQMSSDQFSRGDDGGQKWVAQVEPGVLITFVALSDGGNELRRIRFNREMFNKRQAEVWWTQNSERVHELYNVRLKDKSASGLRSITSSNEVKSNDEFKAGVSANSPRVVGEMINSCQSSVSNPESQTVNSNVTDAAASDIPSSNDSDWVIEDEPGVFVTVKVMPGGSKALKRVRFRCEKFNEQQAKEWWEKNRFRVHEQYLRKHLPNVSYTSI